MVIETQTTKYLTTDSGLVIEVPQVAATFIAFQACARGVFTASRRARARRSDARRHRRVPEAFGADRMVEPAFERVLFVR